MKLKFEKHITEEDSAIIKSSLYIHVEILAIPGHEQKIGYAVQNMAYSLGYDLVKKEESL